MACDRPPEKDPGHADLDMSSDAEDLALLEEVTRIKARLEEKLRAKRLRSATLSKETLASTVTPTGISLDPHPHVSQDKNKKDKDTGPTPLPTSPKPDTMADTAVTTPTKSRTPLTSPGFRTPSPPARTRYLMSPPSGAIGRKRQHSPSPLPKRSSVLNPPDRYLNFTAGPHPPTRHSGGNAPAKESKYDLEDELDEASLDLIMDGMYSDSEESIIVKDVAQTPESHLDAFGPSVPVKASASLMEKVETLNQNLAITRAKTSRPKITFQSLADSSRNLTSKEVADLGHTPDFDPLSSLRIVERTQSCGQIAQMTLDLKRVPIKDSGSVRDSCNQSFRTGVLAAGTSSTQPLSVGPGRIVKDQTVSGEKGPLDATDNWVLAGVVGAKSQPRMTARKKRYVHFQLSDLHNNAVNVFLFHKVMEKHYKHIQLGDIVAVMNPKVLRQTERTGTLGLEVELAECLVVLGKSIDFGQCEAVKLDGKDCGKALDKRSSLYCTMHIMMATNKHRNQRGSLLVGTSSVYDFDKPQGGANPTSRPQHGPRAGAIRKPSSNPVSANQALWALGESGETTYIFDDGGIGSSSLMDSRSTKKDKLQEDDALSAFLMNQNNPGGQYLRQAKASKDVAWAKDVTSPKTPTKTSELFPAEMIRRMGYDPVTGQFVPGSPKRMTDDPQARERSIRLLAERVRSPPASLNRPLALGEKRRKIVAPSSVQVHIQRGSGQLVQGDVFFGQGLSRTEDARSEPPSAQKWVDLDESDDSGDDGSSSVLFQQRTKNLLENARLQKGSQPPALGTRSVIPQYPHQEQGSVPSQRPIAKLKQKRPAESPEPRASRLSTTPALASSSKSPTRPSLSQTSTAEPPSKKAFVDFSDSE